MYGPVTITVALLACGCGFEVPVGASATDGGDGSGSATGDGGLGCYGTGLVIVCPITQPPPSYTITVPTTLDTNVIGNCTTVNGSINGGAITGVCVVIAEDVAIKATLRGIGPRPLVIVATKALTVEGLIDVASHRNSQGAGTSTTVCANGVGPTVLGGGAGGAFGGQGGLGGNAEGGTSGPIAIPPTALRGGCRGQGGSGLFGVGGDGGYGGGVFYAIAGTEIAVAGAINASGEGGRGGTFAVAAGGGGGGGGSGGMIGLDAPNVRVMGELFANGGGGGGGSSGVENAGGGDDPQSAQAMPEGGANAFGAGKGGRGAVGMLLAGGDGEPSTATTGGGGGGGGAGHIAIYGTLTVNGNVSPLPGP